MLLYLCDMRSRIKLLSYIIPFCTRLSHQGKPFVVQDNDENSFQLGVTPKTGDLVIMTGVIHPGEWYLSWVAEAISEHEAVLESVETGKLCRWYNVGFYVFKNPQEWWRWTDDQFKFYDWCKKGDFIFNVTCSFEGNKVKVTTKGRYSLTKYDREFVLEDYRKVKYKELKELLNKINESTL